MVRSDTPARGGFLVIFFWNEHIKRFLAGSAQHKQSFLYFFEFFPLAVLPWVFLIPAALYGLGKRILNERIMRFSLCWFVLPFLFFSASSGKLLTYILPCLPPFAVIMATGLSGYLSSGRVRAFKIGAMLFICLICLVAAALPALQINGLHGLRPYSNIWRPCLLTAGLLSWALCVVISIRMPHHKILLYAAAPLLFMFAARFCIPDLTIRDKMPGEFLSGHLNRISQDSVIVSDEAMISPACWFYKRNDIYLAGKPGEFEYGISYEDSSRRYLAPEGLRDFILKNKGAGPVTLVARAKTYKNWEMYLPGPVFKDSSGDDGFVFVQF